jgi:hypothetical protein
LKKIFILLDFLNELKINPETTWRHYNENIYANTSLPLIDTLNRIMSWKNGCSFGTNFFVRSL